MIVIARYILIRLLALIPALLLLSILVFLLRSNAPDEIIENQVSSARIENASLTEQQFQSIVREIRSQWKLDRPLFYFSITSIVLPDSLVAMYPPQRAQLLKSLLFSFGRTDQTASYYQSIIALSSSQRSSDQILASRLLGTASAQTIEAIIDTEASPALDHVSRAFQGMKSEARPYQYLIPSFRWYGIDNQFHFWLASVFTLDLGRSFIDRQLVTVKVATALGNTLLITLPAFFLLILISIPLGTWLASKQGLLATSIRTLLLTLDAIPLFWLCLILIVLFASGIFLNVLPAFGVIAFSSGSDLGFFQKAAYLVLPVSALVLSAMSYVSLQVMKAVEDEQGKLYVTAARTRGLDEGRILWVHVLRNSLIPVITILSDYFSAAFAGSLVVEVIYSIPGMGKLLYDSVLNRDVNVIIAVILFIALIKMISNLLADLGYRLANPSISFRS